MGWQTDLGWRVAVTREQKAQALRLSAGHLEAIGQDKLSEEHLDPEDRKIWGYILTQVVPGLDSRAARLEKPPRKKRFTP